MRQWWERRSLRLRLTLWYAITSAIILLGLGGMLLFVVHGRLISQMDRQLRGDFEMVESRVARDSALDPPTDVTDRHHERQRRVASGGR